MCTICQALTASEPYAFHDLGTSAALVETSDAAASISTAYSMTSADTFSGTFQTASDEDWIMVSIPDGQTWDFTLVATAGTTDPILVLYDASGAFVKAEDGFSNGPNASYLSYSNTSGSAQTFYISASDHLGDDTGSYELSISAFTPPPLTEWTYDEIADQLTSGYWNNPGGNYSGWDISPGDTITVDITRLTADGQYLAEMALDAWTMVLGVNFNIIANPSSALTENASGYAVQGNAIIFDDDEGGAFANFVSSGTHVAADGTTTYSINNAKVNVSTGWLASYGTDLNTYSFQTYIHEIGHAIGLGHAGDYNGSASYPSDAKYLNDSWQATVMSYFSQTTNTYVDADYNFTVTPMIADMIAVQKLYGVAGNIRPGNTTYGFNSTAGGYYDMLVTLSGIAFTIIDDGGIDTLDLSGLSVASTINMGAGEISDVGGQTGNVIIYETTILENLVLGSAADTVIGNEASNTILGGGGADTLTGGAGNDVLDGGAGGDVAHFVDDISLVSVTALDTGSLLITSSEGVDEVRDIENFVFAGVGFTLEDLLDLADGTIVTGSDLGETLTGTDADEVFRALGGNDSVLGGGGADLILTGSGDDSADGGSGSDTLLDFLGDNTLSGGGDDDILIGGIGSDTLVGGTGNDVMAADPLPGFGNSDTIDGGAGDDLLSGGLGADVFVFRPDEGVDTIAQVTFATGSGLVASAGGQDFDPFFDKLDLSAFGFASQSDALAAFSVGSSGAVFQHSGTQITLVGVDIAELTSANIIIA